MIPDLTRAVGVPRLAGISYPLSRPLGNPHDADGQRAVLRAMLEVLTRAAEPDTYVEAVYVARIAGPSAQLLQRYSAIADRRARDEEAVAVGESLQRSHSGA